MSKLENKIEARQALYQAICERIWPEPLGAAHC